MCVRSLLRQIWQQLAHQLPPLASLPVSGGAEVVVGASSPETGGQLCSPRPARYFLAGEGSDVPSPCFFLSLPCRRSPLFIRGWLVGDSRVELRSAKVEFLCLGSLFFFASDPFLHTSRFAMYFLCYRFIFSWDLHKSPLDKYF